jgi:hypothetical protein
MRARMGCRTLIAILLGVLVIAADSGGATVERAGTAQHGCPRIYWRTLRDGAQVCPPRHSVIGGEALTGLRWSAWTASGARGSGNLTCTDSGCLDEILAHADVRLSRVRRCPDGARIFTRFDVHLTDRHEPVGRHWGWRIPCDGMTGGGNG